MENFQNLRPWRYNHYLDGQLVIPGDDQAIARNHDEYGTVVLNEILASTIGEPGNLRALDMGCLEGHYSEILCEFGFGEVVSVDLSEDHIRRAKFILHELRGFRNSTVVQGNVTDKNFMESLGRFDLIFFHGLLYHLSSPIEVFEIIENLIRDPETFYLLLGHQFKMNRGSMIQLMPLAELKFRSFDKDEDGKYQNPNDASVYAGPSLRLNVTALYQLLVAYGYKQLIAYDKIYIGDAPRRMNIQLILRKCEQKHLIRNLNADSHFGSEYYYEWQAQTVSDVNFRNNIRISLLRFMYRLLNKIGNLLVR